jgi:hypothetical protein
MLLVRGRATLAHASYILHAPVDAGSRHGCAHQHFERTRARTAPDMSGKSDTRKVIKGALVKLIKDQM